MDGRTRALWRGLIADGTLVETIVSIIKDLDPASPEALEINRYLKFYADRMNYKWRLGGDWNEYEGRRDPSKQFPIAHLGDATITRLIDETPCRRIQKYYLERGEDRPDANWSDESWAYTRRSAYVVVLEEAEYRGILSQQQKAWRRVRDGGDGSTLVQFDEACNERGGHAVTFVREEYVCMNCRRKVTREEVLRIADRMLRGRLREFAC